MSVVETNMNVNSAIATPACQGAEKVYAQSESKNSYFTIVLFKTILSFNQTARGLTSSERASTASLTWSVED